MKQKGKQALVPCNNQMEIKQLKYIKGNEFTPWNDEQEEEIYQPNPAAHRLNKHLEKQYPLRKQKLTIISTSFNEDNIEEKATKTLLTIDKQEKQLSISHIKAYLEKKRKQHQSNHPEVIHSAFRLPHITKANNNLNPEHRNKYIRNSNSLVMANKFNIDNQEEQIFRKYGEHRPSPNSVERSISYGSAIASSRKLIGDNAKKYETLDPNREKNDFQRELKHLKLNGKKYSYDTHSRNKRKQEYDINYLPSEPNITPHHLLFGHNQEEVFKKIFQQLQHKVK